MKRVLHLESIVGAWLAVLVVSCGGAGDAGARQFQDESIDHGASPAPDHLTGPAASEKPAALEPGTRTPAGASEHREGSAGSSAGTHERPGEVLTFRDGDAERTVRPVAQEPQSRAAGTGAVPEAGRGQRTVPGGSVFVSESGSRMTLPGGVVLLLDPAWSASEAESFFAANEIPLDQVSELGWIGNGFLVATEPGMASLELANVLASQPGVELSSPNWARELVPE